MDLAKQFGIGMQGHAAFWHGNTLPIDGHVKKKGPDSLLNTKYNVVTHCTSVICSIYFILNIYFYLCYFLLAYKLGQ